MLEAAAGSTLPDTFQSVEGHAEITVSVAFGADGGDPTGVDPDGEHVNVAGAHALYYHTSLLHVVFQRLTSVAVWVQATRRTRG